MTGEPDPAPGTHTGQVTSQVNMADVARRAGVSIATVSRALRGLPGVSPRTRSRVLSTVEELDYVVSPAASSLRGASAEEAAMHVTREPEPESYDD